MQQEPNNRAPRVVLVDADRRVRQSLSDLLSLAGVDVAGTAPDVRTALELCEREAPGVLLVDPRLPDLRAGAALLNSVRLAWPSTRVVTMGWSSTNRDDAPALNGQYDAVVAKDAAPEEFLAAILDACNCPRPSARTSAATAD